MSETSALPQAPSAAPAPVAEWGRLDPRMIIVRPLNELLGLIPVLVALVAVGHVDGWRLAGSLVALGLLISRGLLLWVTTKYRITDTQVELHHGLLNRKSAAIPRDRIRTVDLTAKLGHRLFGLSAIRIGTGQHERKGEGVELDAVSSAEADRLRQVLLRRSVGVPAGRSPGVDAPAPAQAPPLARWSTSWLRFAPLTMSGLITIGAAVGIFTNIANELNVEISGVGVVRDLVRWVSRTPAPVVVAVSVLVVAALAVLASLLAYVVQNWNYRITREADGTLRVRRGLLTTRSVSVEEKRLRGVALHEPLLLRAGRGAKLTAVTSGLAKQSHSSLLLPPAPAQVAHRLAEDVLAESPAPTLATLTPHPARARLRRLVRAVAGAVLLDGLALLGTAIGWLPAWVWLAGLALLPLAVLLGQDRYRALGHALTPRYLLSRSGSLDRRTVALQRTGIIGWRISSSLFQRRAGLVTLTATTAAGSGAYHVLDIATADALALADEALPGLLAPFLA